jgi:O-antigen/teichoic acid export membrane protein
VNTRDESTKLKLTLKNAIRKFSYSLSANAISAVATTSLGLLVPAFLDVTQFGYWQLYIFYVGYAIYFHFGWADGMYLRYGGKTSNEMDRPVVHSQFWLFAGFEFLLFLGIAAYALFFLQGAEKRLIILCVGLNCIVYLPRVLLQYLLQGIGRVSEYARNLVHERLLDFGLILLSFLLGYRDFPHLIIADFVAKGVTLFWLCYHCRDIVFAEGVPFAIGIREAKENLAVGFKLMFATVASMLIIGIVQYAISLKWDISTFGMVSFALVVAQSIVLFINQISMVLFPLLKQSEPSKFPVVFHTMGTSISLPVLVLLLSFYPLQLGLGMLLPEYREGISYLAILFPICLFESRTSLLLGSFMKTFRKERSMLWINLSMVVLSVCSTVVTIGMLEDIVLGMISIVALLALRCIIADLYVQRLLSLHDFGEIVLLVSASAFFVYASFVVGGWTGWGMYGLFLLVAFLVRRKQYLYSLRVIGQSLKSRI